MHNTQTPHQADTSVPLTPPAAAAAAESRHRGSVLIFVVAILTLLALIGTAFMATVRTDRYAAPPDASDPDETAADLLPGLQSVVVKAIGDDVYDGSTTKYRPGVPTDTTSRYENWDSGLSDLNDPTGTSTKQADGWLGERIPTPWDPNAALAANNPPVWRVVTRPLNGDTTYTFETPYFDYGNPTGGSPPADYSSPFYTLRHDQHVAVPAWQTITYTTNTSSQYYDASVAGKTRVFPAFHLYTISGGTLNQVVDSTGQPAGYIAGDADGDGIADCGLWRLSDSDGVTYYAGVRVIDNNSAVNVNTAWSRDHDFDFAGGATVVNNAYFPSNIGLLELLGSISTAPVTGGPEDLQMQAVNHDRFNYGTNPAPWNAANTPVADGDPYDTNSTNDDPTNRGDFTYASQGEAIYFQLGRRLGNPGYRLAGTTSGSTPTAVAYTPYKFSDVEQYLSYHFVFVNPDTRPRTFELSLKNAAPGNDSVVASAPNFFPTQGTASSGGKAEFTYFPANEMLYWYYYNFEFDDAARNNYFTSTLGFTAAPRRSVRPLLVSSNPVSNHIPVHLTTGANAGTVINDGMAPYGTRGRWSAELAYTAGDIVYHYQPGLVPAETRVYLCVQNQTANMGSPPVPGGAGTPNYWVPLNPRGEYLAGAAPAYAIGDVVRVVNNAVNPATTDIYVATAVPSGAPAGVAANGWRLLSDHTNPPKTSINTAPFAELWRAFWNVMSEDDTDGTNFTAYRDDVIATTGAPSGGPALAYWTPGDPGNAADPNWYDPYLATKWGPAPAYANVPGMTIGGTPNAPHPLAMFRSSLREARHDAANPNTPFDAANQSNRFRASDMVQLRSALAAVNAEALRDLQANPTVLPSRKIHLNAMYRPAGGAGAATLTPVEVTVYGQKPQLFITEIYANTDTLSDFAGTGTGASNPGGYVAVELYNPNATAVNIAGWRLAALDRRSTVGTHPDMPVTPIGTPLAGVIPPGGYVILENYDAAASGATTSATNATARPPVIANAILPTANPIFVDGLADALDRELVLLRPPDPAAPPANIEDYAPVDSYDFTGLVANGVTLQAWHYVRPTGTGIEWQCVYPGRYDAGVINGQPRHQGTQVDLMNVDASTTPPTVTDPWDTAPPGSAVGQIGLGMADPVASYAPTGSGNTVFSIPLALNTWPSNPGPAVFPYNGFGHAGDILQVPYIGSYRVRVLNPATGALLNPANTVLELNGVSMDSVFAEDTSIGDDAIEQIGRFCPLPNVASSPYDFAKDLLDHFTAIQNPHDDFLPNVDPARYVGAAPAPVSNTAGAVPNGYTDQDTPIQGLINVNTAPWPVLAMAPLVSNGGVVDVPRTIQLAKDIVSYRNQNGPFKSLFDLNKVTAGGQPVFQNAENTFATAGDFRTQFAQVTRLSNLLTTRSDTFTVYLLVQGWKNVGTPYPQLVTERRSAFTVDRSMMNATTTTPSQTNLPSD